MEIIMLSLQLWSAALGTPFKAETLKYPTFKSCMNTGTAKQNVIEFVYEGESVFLFKCIIRQQV